MYSSGYSQVLKSSPQAQKKMAYRSKGKSCGYYMRIVFFFSSLIQSLIIVSLVLFLVYGKTQDSASTLRIHDLEESFSRLSIENVALKQQRKNLTNLLNTTLTENGRNKWDLNNLRFLSNISLFLIQENEAKLKNCSGKLQSCERPGPLMRTFSTFKPPDLCNCGLVTQTLQSKLMLVETNFTQTVQRMRDQLDRTAKERDATTLDAIQLRRDKYKHEKEVEFFRQKCKEDFSQSLSGISEVSRAFLQKIDSLFPSHIAFQLTCPKQREHLEQIRTNCSSLSTEVEDRLQHYLDVVGEKISVIEGENSRLKAENWRLSEDYRSCSNNRTALILQNRQNAEKLQQNHDEVKERLLMDKIGLNGELEVEKKAVKFQSSKIDMLIEQIKKINASCPTKPGYGVPAQPGWALGGSNSGSASPSGGSQLGRSGTGIGGSTGFDFTKALSTGPGGSTGFDLNKPVSTGLGGSTGFDLNKPVSTGSGGSTGFDLNKPVSSGSGGSTGSTFNKPVSPGSSSSIGSTFDKPVSTGSGGSTGSTFNKPVSTGSSGSIGSTFNKPVSPGSSSSIGSTFNKPVSTGSGGSTGSTFNKPVSTGSGSSTGSGLDPQRSSSWSTNKSVPTNSGMSVPAAGNSNSGQSRTGSATGRATSTGNSGGHIISVDQHIRDLQRIINPTGPQDKQDLFKMLG